jgi:hypothetical protein
MARHLLVLSLLGAALFAPGATNASAPPVAHTSVTCADFPNQAAAQRAHNTRDADGDGIYCEDLPCPCLKPGQSSPAPKTPARKPSLFAGRCKRGILPDRHCSPGKVATTDIKRVCTPGYTQQVRNVSEPTKNQVYFEYGIRRHSLGEYEVDHIVPLEVGGSNSIRNLYPETEHGPLGSLVKNKLENALHRLVCSGTVPIRTAQRAFETDWVAAYKRYVG